MNKMPCPTYSELKAQFIWLTTQVSDYVLSSQTEKLTAGTKFSDYLGLNHYKKAKKLKHFIHLRLASLEWREG